ncbi:MAG: hypothetical protein AB8G15_05575 [Saprospiraceae bacterium]
MTSNLPFGEADASNVNFSELKETYISFRNGDSSLQDSIDPSVRVIFGKKGSGKTLYLRAIVDHLKNTFTNVDSNYVTNIDNEPPSSYLISKVSSWFTDEPRKADEIWRDVWKVVIIKTTLSHILYSPHLSSHISQNKKEELLSTYKEILPKGKAPATIFSQLKSTLNNFNSEKDLERFVNNELWGSLEFELSNIIQNTPPIYFFLDQLDDDFINSPHAWLSCQYGLFRAIFRFIRNGTYGRRLHVIACLREFVYAYVLNNQDGSKYYSESKIVVLKWNQNDTSYFLKKKVENLDKKYFRGDDSKSLESYFGLKNVVTKRDKDYKEDLDKYIVRHTMLMPRNIIDIGNEFYKNVNSITNKNSNLDNLRKSVKNIAKQIATEQLNIVAMFITTKWIYKGAYEQGVDNVYYEDYFVGGTQHNLEKLIISIKKDRFTNQTLMNRIRDKGNYGFDKHEKPFNAMFLTGLLGYVNENEFGEKTELFFSESRESQYQLPMHKKEYVFHSSLIDYLGIKPTKAPVYAQY